MPTITRTDIRGEMLRRAPVLGRRLTADSLTKATTNLIDVSEYERQRAGLTSFENQYIYRYLQADPDNWRLIETIDGTTGTITMDGPNWVNNTDLAYERLNVFPDDLNMAIQEGQRRQRVRTNIALVYPAIDLDMEAANSNFWNGVSGNSQISNLTVAKDATVAFSGTQSALFSGTGATPFVRSAYMRVSPNRQTYVAAIVILNAGPVSMNLYDPVNNVFLGSTVTQTVLSGWTVFMLQAQTNANTYIVQIQFTSSNASCVFWVDTCFGPYQAGQTEYPLQTALNEAYKLRFVRPANFVSPTQVQGLMDANSLGFVGDLIRPQDWDMEVFKRDVNSNRLRFQADSYNNRNIGWGIGNRFGYPVGGGGTFMQNQMRPVWLAMEAQVSDFEPLLTEAATTSQPLDECACYSLRWLAETMTQRDPSNPVWQNMLQEYKVWSVIEDSGRPPQAMYTPQRYHAQLA